MTNEEVQRLGIETQPDIKSKMLLGQGKDEEIQLELLVISLNNSKKYFIKKQPTLLNARSKVVHSCHHGI